MIGLAVQSVLQEALRIVRTAAKSFCCLRGKNRCQQLFETVYRNLTRRSKLDERTRSVQLQLFPYLQR